MNEPMDFGKLITRSSLRELAGDKYYPRGEAYFRAGAVFSLSHGPEGIAARVVGTEPYVARLWLRRGNLVWGCSCPLGQDEGAFCKHIVAAGLAWLSRARRRAPKLSDDVQAIRDSLRTLDQDALLDLITERAGWDEGFCEEVRLLAEALHDMRGPGQTRKGEPGLTKRDRAGAK